MSTDLFELLREAETAVRQGRSDDARLALSRARAAARQVSGASDRADQGVARYHLVLQRTLQVALASGLMPVATQVLDGMLAIVGARRGFVGVTEGEPSRGETPWRLVVARALEQADIADPASAVSTRIIAEVLATGEPVLAHDAAEDEFVGQASVDRLHLRSVVCLPLRDAGRTIGFVYLDDPETRGLFDDAAVAAVTAWLPYVASVVARAVAEEVPTPGLPGVVTRSPRMLAELSELARAAAFDAPVLLTGETGTGKSLVAQALHRASPRAARPFIHVNCGAIPENLLESELFGHAKGAFTGATSDRAGRFEAAEGGTLFLDELDSMPLACQVKLLVVLQERAYTPVGRTRAVPCDVRIIAAMGAEPADAIEEGRLREDLYYRLAVFVTRLPPLRERPEDIPLLVAHFLEDTRSRYKLPPLRLAPRALDELLQRAWPGNVRELANTLDRAALLARGGVIESIAAPHRRGGAEEPGGAGLVPRLEGAARQFVEAGERHPALRSLAAAEVFRSLVLVETVRREGSREAGFVALGLESLVAGRNHQRAYKREVERIEALVEALGEALSPELAALC